MRNFVYFFFVSLFGFMFQKNDIRPFIIGGSSVHQQSVGEREKKGTRSTGKTIEEIKTQTKS